MPLAEPLRSGGAEAIRMLLLGDWNSPNPAPQSTSRQMMSKSVGCSGRKASRNSPAAIIVSPVPPSSPAYSPALTAMMVAETMDIMPPPESTSCSAPGAGT